MSKVKFFRALHTPSGKIREIPEKVAKDKVAMNLGKLVLLEEDEPDSDEMASLKEEYKSLTGRNPHYKWTEEKIAAKIEEIKNA